MTEAEQIAVAVQNGAKLSPDLRDGLEAIVRLNPSDFSARLRLLGYYTLTGGLDAATRKHEHVIALIREAPDQPILGTIIGFSLTGTGPGDERYDAESSAWESACQRHPTAAVFANAARFFGRYECDRAARLYRRAAQLDPGSSAYRRDLASVLERMGRWMEAAETYSRLFFQGDSGSDCLAVAPELINSVLFAFQPSDCRATLDRVRASAMGFASHPRAATVDAMLRLASGHLHAVDGDRNLAIATLEELAPVIQVAPLDSAFQGINMGLPRAVLLWCPTLVSHFLAQIRDSEILLPTAHDKQRIVEDWLRAIRTGVTPDFERWAPCWPTHEKRVQASDEGSA